MRVRPLFVHFNSSGGRDDRFDTIAMPNASVAVCCAVAQQHGYCPMAYDTAFPSPQLVEEAILAEIDTILARGEQPALFATLLNYNAEETLRFFGRVKREWGQHVRTGVGGQLVRTAVSAYEANPNIDHVGVGDAEVVLPRLLAGEVSAEGYLADLNPGDWPGYAEPSYDTYFGLAERLDVMSRFKLGPFTGLRQLLVESVRACSWAFGTGKACTFCSLEGIDRSPQFRPFAEGFALEQRLVEKYGINWVFDVSNQWLPKFCGQEAWLEEYLRARDTFGATDVQRYAYLTAMSLTPTTAPLLAKAGIKVAYVGFDGWDDTTRKGMHKANVPVQTVVEAAQDADIYLRCGFVIGDGATEANLPLLPEFIRQSTEAHADRFISMGFFPQIILPGSRAWSELTELTSTSSDPRLTAAARLFRKMETHGYLSRYDENELTRIYLEAVVGIAYDQALAVRDECVDIAEAAGIVGTTIEHGGGHPQAR